MSHQESSPFGHSLDATTRALDQRHGFVHDPQPNTGAAVRRQWLRRGPWRTDVVEIVYRRGGELRALVNLVVRFPAVGVDRESPPFDARSIETPRVPIALAALRASGYGRRVAGLVVAALPWFEHFATPALCLERLTAPDRCGAASGPAHEAVIHYLRSLPPQ